MNARSARVRISATTREEADTIVRYVHSKVPEPAAGTVKVRIWPQRQGSFPNATFDEQELKVPRWGNIARNYPTPARKHIDVLMVVNRPEHPGRLLLWHGPPGTGKTTALRALMAEWSSWCSAAYIADPERFFADVGYMTHVLSAATGRDDGPTLERAGRPAVRWRLIVAEDSDEYLRASARRDAGSAMGRLLNLTDGILGQSYHAIVIITTNEELNRLHPGLTRPGRCLARVEFPRFGPHEARAWLGSHHRLPERPLTLAELLALRGDFSPLGVAADQGAVPIGAYL